MKEALSRDITVSRLAMEKARRGELRHRDEGRPVTEAEIEAALRDLRRLTEGGLVRPL